MTTMTNSNVDTVAVPYSDDPIIFTRLSKTVFADYPYHLRIEADRPLSEIDARTLAGLVGYVYRATIAGERLGMVQSDSPRSIWFAADTTKTARDDIGMAFEEFLFALPTVVQYGTPIRKTNRAGADTKGTRLIDGLGDVQISVWADSVFID